MTIGVNHSPVAVTKPRTLVGLLKARALHEPGRVAYRFLSDGETQGESVTYGELESRARSIAAALQGVCGEGERALLLYPPGLDYVAAFFGCIYAGVIAVPAFPPHANRRQRLESIAADSQAALALTTGRILERVSSRPELKGSLDQLSWLATDLVVPDSHGPWREPESLDEGGLAYLQYTSGSTSAPKGVMVTHANVLHNSAYIHQGFGHTPESVSLSWLPHFHDMGLLDGIIQPLYGGFTGLLMSPAAFLQRPLGWLKAVSLYRVTHSGGPNFAYDLCVRRVGPEQRAQLDLSSWRVAYNGAEPVRAETLARFAEAFAPCGFRSESFYPAYGLAEATLKVSGGVHAGDPVIFNARGSALGEDRVAEAAGDEEDARPLVGCGRAALSTEVRIVHPETLAECAADEVGEIWVRGPGVAAGYWRRPEETERTFRAYLHGTGEGPFLRTGDLGFVRSGELFVTGRLKDLIIIRGRNHYPQDIEATVERAHPSLRPAAGAAFSVEVDGEERLVVAQEVETRRPADWESVVERIREAVTEEFEIQPASILLLKPGSIPKTSSGKIRRADSRAMFLRREWQAVAEWSAPRGEGAAPDASEPSTFSSAASVENWLRERLEARLGLPAGEMDVNRPLARYGVDSLLAVELMHDIETRAGVALPLADFLQSPSLAELAARAARQLSAPATPRPRPETNGAERGRHPLSHNQKSLWFMHHVAPDSAAYNVSFAARIRGGLETEALQRAFQALVNRHPSLRTGFESVEGEPVQRVRERAAVFFQSEDARHLDESQLRGRMGLEARHRFDLADAPLLRVFLFRRADDEHVLLLVAHHLVVDFWSLSVLMRELGELYDAEVEGRPAALEPPAPQYADYVSRQREWLESADGEGQRRFWLERLSGELPALDLPTDYPRPAVQSYRGASLPLRLDARLTEKLKALARSNDVTLYMLLLAAFEALLYRHTGQSDILVGTPTAGRGSAGLRNAVGYFVNPVALRAKLSAEMPFEELLAQTRRDAVEAFSHQDYPFELLVKQLQPARDASRAPLFQAMFALHRAQRPEEQALSAFALGEAGAEVNLGGLRLESMALDQRAAQFDLSLTAAEVGGELAASFEYCTELFAAPTIERMAEHFRVLLEGIVAAPSRPLAALPLLTRAERRQLLREWNDMQPAKPAALVHELFERQAAQRPGQAAVVGAAGQLSYGELNSRAERLARHLRARGVGPNVVVAICAERSPEMLVGVLGILKAGGAYVPLDPAYPPARLAFMLEDTAAPFLLTQRKLTGAFQSPPAEVILLDEDWPPAGRGGDGQARVEVGAENLAYVIYTSGSTGRPKGVMISHGALSHYIATVTDEYKISSADRMLQFASLSFDISVEEIFSSLTTGATLVLRDEETTASPDSLLRLCREQRVTLLNLPTAYWHQLAAGLTPDDWGLAETVRLVIIGSEKLQPERLAQWHAAVGGRTRLVDVYGPTEATVGSTIYDLNGVTGAPDSARKISIGRPFRHAQAYVLDARLQPVPVGVAGELHLGGHALSQGYLKRPALTAAAFIPHPFGETPGARLYKTGDLARFLPDGNIEFLGRLDGQVKVRGFRIEAGEIERALVRHEGVREAVVVVGAEGGEKRLVAYLVASSSGEPPTIRDLRQHLKESLPAYMLPSAFVFLDALPLTPSGKVDQRALPAPERSGAESAQDFDAPRTELERALAGIWADALRLERVGLHDNFFELGGDSILIIQIVARARAAGINLSATQMFECQTVAELAAAARTTPSATGDETAAVGEAPLTPIQRWFFEQEFEAADHWNMALLLEAQAPVRAEWLEQALSLLLARHDSLRLRFVREGGGWRQFIAEPSETSFSLRRVDLSAVPEGERAAAVEAVAAETQAQLSLAEGRMLRAVLFEFGETRAPRLLLVAHHLATDGVSWGILLEDLSAAYARLQRGEGVELPPKTTSFKAWAERLDEHARSAAARRGAEYWAGLAEKEFKSLPVDRPGGAALEDSTRVVSTSLSAAETHALLHDAPPVYHTQVNDVLLTALVAAFARWTGGGALLVDLEGHGREELFAGVNLSRTIGWFTNVFPVLLRLDEPFTPGAALKSIKEQLRAVPDHGMGYGVLRYADGAPDLKAALAFAPPAQVSFNYLGRVDRMLESASGWTLVGEGFGTTRGRRNRRTHLLEVNAGVYDGELRLDWSYSRDLHDRSTVERLAADYLETLRAVVAHCLSPEAGGHTPSDFPLAKLEQGQLDELLRTAGEVADIYPLSPMQQGMLFHSLYAPAAGMYVEQLSCVLKGGLDVAAFEAAWQSAAARHPVLRTAFVWENLNDPLQVVWQSVSLAIDQYDWRGLARDEQERLLEAHLSADRLRAFDLGRAPLMRLALARTALDAYHFVWTHHHLLLDGWSAASLLREVLTSYESLRRGEGPPARRPPPFRNYIAWSRRQDASKAERFWRDELKGFIKPTLLTTSRPAGGGGEEPPRVSKREERLTAEETAALHAFARSSQLTLGTLVHGAFALLLGRYSGETDVVFGTTVSGRPPALAGVDEMVGLFINTLPVRVRVGPRASVLAWLRELQAKLAALRDYEYSSLAEIQGWSDVPRGQALFECLLAFENYPVDAALLDGKGGLTLEDVRSFERTNYPLTIAALPGDGLRLQALYTDDRFDDETAARLLAHLKRLLLDIAAAADKSLADVRLLDEDERRLILNEWNRTATPYPREQTVQQLFEAQAARAPEALAVVCGEERLTYAELNARANRLAHRLREKGVGPEATVGVLMERSAELIVALLGVLKAGGAYLPLDPAHPQERLSYVLGDAGARLLLTTARLAEDWPDDPALTLLRLDADARLLTEGGEENPRAETSADSLAYVIYTSGSTGRPKGVCVTHRNVARLVCNADYLQVREADRVAHLSNVAFDAATFEIWGALLNGAGLVVLSRQVALSQHELLGELRRQQVSVLFMTTALFNEMARQTPDAFAGLGHLLTGGETAEPRWFREVLERGAPGRLLHVYGPTENCTYSTWHEVEALADDARQIPIGRPVANTQAYVLDTWLRPVPVGVVGELCLGGDGLARGYRGRPALTAELFVPNPYGLEAGARLYRTGDLARFLPDGQIEFLGRADNQVKVRGFRIELGEIEAALSAHEAVGGAVVVAREDVPGEKRLVAYVVAAAGRGRGEVAGELRAYLRERLPDYMVPSAFVELESLPLTPNGKVDRRALPAPDAAGAQAGAEFVTPRTPLEEALADIWRGVLGVERVGVNDNFFELGGHSLMATRVLSNVRRIFRIELPLRVIFESATVAELATAVAAFETRPGQVEKIARVLQKLKSIPAEEARRELQRKRRERSER